MNHKIALATAFLALTAVSVTICPTRHRQTDFQSRNDRDVFHRAAPTQGAVMATIGNLPSVSIRQLNNTFPPGNRDQIPIDQMYRRFPDVPIRSDSGAAPTASLNPWSR